MTADTNNFSFLMKNVMDSSGYIKLNFISYDKHIVEHIAGEINVGRGEQGEK